MRVIRTSCCASLLVLASTLAACMRAPSSPQASSADDVAAIRALVAKIEPTFQSADIDGAMELFADDAVIVAQGMPDVEGKEAIRAVYRDMLDQYVVAAHLTTLEVEAAGDLGYERGTYTLKLTDKASGNVALNVVNRHVHVLRRQPDGTWKTWRMIVNSAEPAP